MLKFLITGVLIYFVYRFFIATPAIGENESYSNSHTDQERPQQPSSSHNDEYIDYEEVE